MLAGAYTSAVQLLSRRADKPFSGLSEACRALPFERSMRKKLMRWDAAYHVGRHIKAPPVQVLLDTLAIALQSVPDSGVDVAASKAGVATGMSDTSAGRYTDHGSIIETCLAGAYDIDLGGTDMETGAEDDDAVGSALSGRRHTLRHPGTLR